MPTYWGFSPVKSVAPSDDPLIAALATGFRWDVSEITYSFPAAGASWVADYPASYSAEPPTVGFTPLTGANQEQFRYAIARWADLIATPIVQTGDGSGTTVGDIRAAYYGGPAGYDGFAYYPGESAWAGDVWLSPGTSGYQPGISIAHPLRLMLHEIGHALGLKHPNEGAVRLPEDVTNVRYTVMGPGSGYSFSPTTPMLLDIQAIQYMYGANYATRAGDDAYQYDNSRPFHETIWDGAGNDTIMYVGDRDAEIDLNAGHASTIGLEIRNEGTLTPMKGNVWIAYGCSIENATGGAGNDTLIGNAGDNILDGGAGTDTVVVGAPMAGVQSYSPGSDALTVTTVDGTDRLMDIERVELTDALFAFDTRGPDGHTWQAAALYRCGFGSLPSTPDLSRWTAQADQSGDMGDVAQAMINAYAPGISSADLVTHLYTMLVGVMPSAETVQMYVGMVGAGRSYETQGDLFAYAANLPLNTAQMAGFVGTAQQLDPSWF
jgi:serralysin